MAHLPIDTPHISVSSSAVRRPSCLRALRSLLSESLNRRRRSMNPMEIASRVILHLPAADYDTMNWYIRYTGDHCPCLLVPIDVPFLRMKNNGHRPHLLYPPLRPSRSFLWDPFRWDLFLRNLLVVF